MARDTKTSKRDLRVVFAGGLVAVGLASCIGVAHLGDVRLGAGDMSIELAKGESGLQLGIARRTCPPHCGLDISWRPVERLGL